MNYYEELGIRQDAAIAEIRQAYKLLARLLHPDGQPDAQLKAMAECQMRRLNEILAVLTDSQKRRQYDESLGSSPRAALEWAPPPPDPPAYLYQVAHLGLRHWFWVLIGLAVVGVGLWCMEQNTPEAAQKVATHGESAADRQSAVGSRASPSLSRSSANDLKPAPRSPSTEVRAAQTSNPRWTTEGDRAAAEASSPEPSNPSLPKEFPLSKPAAAETPTAATEAVSVGSSHTVSRANEVSFVGNWFFAPELAKKADPNLYPATYVEFLLEEDNGSLVGSYRAKYRIPDQAISSEVQFHVQGKAPNGKSCKLNWTSDDGAQGEAELTLRASNQMNVTWWTTVFGRHAALSSGMAVLIRQQAP